MTASRFACLSDLSRYGAIGLSLLGVALVSAQCGSSDDGSKFGNANPCANVYKGQCGKTCAADTDCNSGLYCSAAGTCTADCAGGECTNGLACTSRGRCGAFAGDLGDGGGNGDGPCASTEVALSKQVPKVLFLLDQSSSMYLIKFPSGTSNNCAAGCRWSTLKDVLIGPAASPGGLLKELEGQAEIALELYSATDSNPNDGDNSFLTGPTDNVCPRFNGKAFSGLSFSLNAYAGAEALLRPATVDDDTPTGPAVRTVVGLAADGTVNDPKGFASVPSATPKVLVLVTDGEPAVCGSSQPSEEGKQQVIKAVQDTYKQNISTFVIAIGDATGDAKEHFDAVANAGQGQDPKTGSAQAVQPSTPQALVDALKKVVLDARTCVYDLQGQVTAGQESKGSVTLNGTSVPYDPTSAGDTGWKLVTPSRIELTGQACATIKSDPNAVLKVDFPCGSIAK